jgi:integrin alpha 7
MRPQYVVDDVVISPRRAFQLNCKAGMSEFFPLQNLTSEQFVGNSRNLSLCRAHEEWGYCQAGISAMVTEDNTALIGAPGPFTWRGTVFAVSVGDDYLFRDKTHYHTPVRGGEAPVDKYAYLGMALAAGNFLPSKRTCGHRLSYAAGAPRSQDVGAVLIFFKCKSQRMRVEQSLRGEKFASR